MLAEVVITLHCLTIILAGSTSGQGLLTRLTLEALALTAQRLEVVEWAGGARCQTSWAVVAR